MVKLLKHTSLNETHPGQNNLLIRNINTRSGMMWVINYPTMNCQLFSIGNAHYMCNEYFLKKTKLEDILLTIKSIVGHKTIMLIDIKSNLIDSFKESLSKYIEKTIDTPYISTNSSKMTTSLVYLNDKYLKLKETEEIKKNMVPSKKEPKTLITNTSRMRSMLDNDR